MRSELETWAAKWGVPIGVALLAIAARALLSTEKATILGLTRTVVVGLFVGATVNLGLADTVSLTDGQRGAVVGVAAVVAEDVVLFLMRLARRLRDDPLAVLNWFLTSLTRLQPIGRKDDKEDSK